MRIPARGEERGRAIEETNPKGITQRAIMGTTVRLAGRATREKRWKWWAINGVVIIVAAVVTIKTKGFISLSKSSPP